jgi:two-component system OmpR family response regulator
VRSRQQLMDDANVLVDDQTITSHIKRIRRKFVAADPAFDRLDTVYGAGYRWKPPAAAKSPAAAESPAAQGE